MNYERLNPKKIFLDRDGDGITDTIDLQLHLNPSCSNPTILSAVMDLSASLGFETMGMNLPLAKSNEERDPCFHHHLFIGINNELGEIYLKKKEGDYFISGDDENSLAKSIREFAFSLISRKASPHKGMPVKRERRRKGFDLLNPFSNQGFYCNSFKNPLHFFSPYKILLFSHLGLDTAAEAVNFTARMGLETLSLSLPLTFPLEEKPKKTGNCIYIGTKEDLKYLRSFGFPFPPHPIPLLPGERAGLSGKLSSNWESGIFLLPVKKKIPDVLICGEEKGLREFLKRLSQISMSSKGVEDPVFNSIKIFLEDLRRFILTRGASKETVPAEKIVKDYTIPDEKKEILRILKEGLKNKGSKPNAVEIQIFLTRPEKVRMEFKKGIERWLKGIGIHEEEIAITVLNAYKPGLSWMREVVLKEIAGMKIDRIEIGFKEFMDHGLEEPIRWLQEIYPIDEILSARLSIPKEKIEFKKDSRTKEVYRVRAWRKKSMVYENEFSPEWVDQLYLNPFPRSGKVHPATGWVRMRVDGKEVVNQRVKTGIERIWEIYQSEILSLIGKEANKVLSRERVSSPQPIFEELRFDVYFDYPMEPLGVGEERISPLEALHEEIYFVTLDFFSHWLENKGIKNLFLGRVLPVIHPNFKSRNGRMKFTLIHQPEEIIPTSQEIDEVRISFNGILLNRLKIGIDFFIEIEKKGNLGWLKKCLKSYGDSKDGVFKISKILEGSHSGKKVVRLIAFGTDFSTKVKIFNRKKMRIPIEIPMERPIGYQEGIRIIRSLESLPGVDVAEEGRSSGGRPIYSIENTHPFTSKFISHAKRMVFRPTFFINCRHHANEISSTNAGLKLSHLLATQPRFQQFLKKANVVINPMENVDGMVILEEMLRLTPTDKLHAGRYNQAGQEYYKEYFNPQTPFGEAKVKPAIYQRWLPDICVDNHGFPSHEWEQPFSGYAPFRFREWWIPRALLYLYLPHLEEKASSSLRINAELLGNWIARTISNDKTITKWNHTFSERYWKYRQRWFKKLSRFNQDIPNLPIQGRFQQTNYSYRYPHITSVDFITEVADETARGELLKICASAHLQTNLAILKLLNYLDFRVNKVYLCEGDEAHFMWYRERPLVLK